MADRNTGDSSLERRQFDRIDPEHDFYASSFGNAQTISWRNRRFGRFVDLFFDARLALNTGKRKLQQNVDRCRQLAVLVIGIAVPGRERDIHAIVNAIARSRHRVDFSIVPMEDRGKFDNVNYALSRVDTSRYDWIIITDDDISTPVGLLDQCLFLAAKLNLKIFQPAHRFHSFSTFQVNQRHWNTLARETYFVESGPLLGLHQSTLQSLLPFPSLRWAWGIDLYWSQMARRQGWKIGVVDAVPIRHKRRIGRSYGQITAIEQARVFLSEQNLDHRRQNFLQTVRAVCSLDEGTSTQIK
jgi:hypothetical protein